MNKYFWDQKINIFHASVETLGFLCSIKAKSIFVFYREKEICRQWDRTFCPLSTRCRGWFPHRWPFSCPPAGDGSIPSAQLKSQGLTYVIWSAEWSEANGPYSFWSFPLWWWFYLFEQSWHSHFSPPDFSKVELHRQNPQRTHTVKAWAMGRVFEVRLAHGSVPGTSSEPRCSSFLPLEMVLDFEVLL